MNDMNDAQYGEEGLERQSRVNTSLTDTHINEQDRGDSSREKVEHNQNIHVHSTDGKES